MSVVVRMEMPRDGLCDLAFSFLDGTFCTIEGNRCNYCDDGAIPKWCPILCQLPEGHGRLVDADAMAKDLKYDCELDAIGLDDMNIVGQARDYLQFDKDCKQNCMWYLTEQKTIVPAERSET